MPRPAAKKAKAKPIKDAKIVGEPMAAERMNIDIDWAAWGDNFKAFARKNPAGLIVGAMAVLLAFLLIFE